MIKTYNAMQWWDEQINIPQMPGWSYLRFILSMIFSKKNDFWMIKKNKVASVQQEFILKYH